MLNLVHVFWTSNELIICLLSPMTNWYDKVCSILSDSMVYFLLTLAWQRFTNSCNLSDFVFLVIL